MFYPPTLPWTTRHSNAVLAFVFPDESGRLSAVITATAGAESLLARFMPFTSSFVAPDYLVFSTMGSVASGFFSPEWRYVPPAM